MDAAVDSFAGEVGIAVEDLSGEFGGQQVGVNEEITFESTSLEKLLMLVEILRQVDSGRRGEAQNRDMQHHDTAQESESVAN